MPDVRNQGEKQPLRVVICTQFFDPEPGGRGLSFARWLKDHGCDVEVLTGFPNYPRGEIYPGYNMRAFHEEELDGIRILRVPLYPSHDQSAIRRIFSYFSFMLSAICLGILRIRKPDVVYVINLPTVAAVALLIKFFYRAPYVFNIPDLWPDSVLESGMIHQSFRAKFIGRILSWWLRKITYRQAAAISVISEGFKRVLIERGVPATKIDVIYNWVDDSLFHPVKRSEAIRQELRGEGRFNFIYAGNVGAMQGIGTLVRAAKRVEEVNDRFQLIIVGAGQCLDQVQSQAAQLRVKSIRFFPWRNPREMLDIYAIADVLVVHLRDLELFKTTIPSKTQVSLAVGRPVLMAVAGECQGIITSARAGMVCPPEDDKEMSKVMLRMMDLTPAELERMGQNGRAYYQQHMSEDIGAAKVLNLLKQASRKTQ